ncbi:hypothetical protein N1031_06820 [Herbiconiux moechotypicola]|uniref:hypothetical protein n=1 Tax=Herbiconiux moechotypicola TaxID=637393 RepID=UPI00217EFFAF|nr:hypothetical protein [Herbiconiux moechotypicola]MCS5729470.1 hypothetical protein [Herbiconiux moechotypicola]
MTIDVVPRLDAEALGKAVREALAKALREVASELEGEPARFEYFVSKFGMHVIRDRVTGFEYASRERGDLHDRAREILDGRPIHYAPGHHVQTGTPEEIRL